MRIDTNADGYLAARVDEDFALGRLDDREILIRNVDRGGRWRRICAAAARLRIGAVAATDLHLRRPGHWAIGEVGDALIVYPFPHGLRCEYRSRKHPEQQK